MLTLRELTPRSLIFVRFARSSGTRGFPGSRIFARYARSSGTRLARDSARSSGTSPHSAVTPMSPPDPIPLLSGTPVVPVLTIERVEDAVPLARALLAGGLKVIEVTLRTRAALETIRAIAAQVPECVVGDG